MGDNSIDFSSRIIRLGVLTTCAAMIANFIPAVYLAVILGVAPTLNDIFRIWLVAAAAYGVGWFIQPTSMFSVLGTSGTYMAWVCGNVADIRIPASTMAQKAAGVETGTPEGEIMSTIGIASSVFVSVILITIFTFVGSQVIPLLPKFVTKAFTYILPAVFGAVYMEMAGKNLKVGAGTLCAALLITMACKALGIPDWIMTVIIIFSGIGVARLVYLMKRA